MKPWRGKAARGCRTRHEVRGDLTARRLPSGCGPGRLTPALGCRAVRGRDADEVEAGVFGEIDFTHTALAYLLQNLVMRDGLTNHTTPPSCAIQLGKCYDLRGFMAMGKGGDDPSERGGGCTFPKGVPGGVKGNGNCQTLMK